MNDSRSSVTLAQAVATLSLAADVGFGLPLETGLQVCALGLALGERMGLSDNELDRVFYLALLRHIGCTANSDEVAAVAGDEIALRRNSVRMDLTDRTGMLPHMLRHVAAVNPPRQRPQALLRLLAGSNKAMAATAAVCEAAATLAGRLRLGVETLADLSIYYERWDGKGMVRTAAGDQITPPVQAVQVAEAANAFLQIEGVDAAADFVGAHSGSIFAPSAVESFLKDPGGITDVLESPSLWDAASERNGQELQEDEVEAVFEVIADFADLRSIYLGGHSRGVAALASEAARGAGLAPAEVTQLRRASLAHDVGRVAISARIWGKSGALTRSEWEEVRMHPYHVERVLARPQPFAETGRLASFHHERCDGSGYHRGTRESTASAKLLAAADALHAMTEPRPHRPALQLEEAADELRSGARAGAYDSTAVECVLSAAGVTPQRPRVAGGLSTREVEVLRLLARGLTKAQVAKELVIAPKTADAHVQHIYAKLGVSTRAGATLFAMKHGLLDTLAS